MARDLRNLGENNDDPYNELNYGERLRAERSAPPWSFFNQTGNPFLGFMQFLRRKPVPKKVIDPQRLMSDLGEISKQRNAFAVGMFVCIAILVLGMVLSSIFDNIGIFIGGVAVDVIIFIVAFKKLCGKTPNGYTSNDYKAYVLEQAIGSVVEEMVFEPNFGIPKNVLGDTGVVRFGNRYDTEDLVTGKYHGVYFVQADLKIEHKNDDSKTTYFKGKWVVIKYPKSFTGMVTVVDKDYKYRKKNRALEAVMLENPVFNDSFHINSSDQHLAYYLLTPQLMERLMYIEQNAHGSVIACFKDGYLHMGINDYRDTFEPNYKQLNMYADIERFKYEFSLVSGLIEILSLDRSVYNPTGF